MPFEASISFTITLHQQLLMKLTKAISMSIALLYMLLSAMAQTQQRMSIMYDALYNTYLPARQPVIFRVGYGF
jgi:hypothetical protein